MSKFKFRLIFSFLGIIIAAALIVILRTGNGIKEILGAKVTAQSNSEDIILIENKAAKMEIPPLPNEHAEYTYEDMNHIYINGIKYDFPLKYSELPDEFSIKLDSEKKGTENMYYSSVLYYNNICWGNGLSSADNVTYNEDNVVIDKLLFAGIDKSEYLPQIVIGGIDAYDADLVALDRAYGYNSKDYYNQFYCVTAEDPNYRYHMSVLTDSVTLFGYYPNNTEEYKSIAFTTREYYLPEDYCIEDDTVNNALEYTPIPEKNEEFKSALDSLTIHEQKITLPCTVNALLYTLRESGAHLEEIKYPKYQEGYGVIKYEAYLITNTGLFPMELLITPGMDIGNSQVSMISAHGNNFQYMKIDGIDEDTSDLVNSFDYNDGLRDALTPYEYNNVFLYGDDLYIYCWGENTTVIEEN